MNVHRVEATVKQHISQLLPGMGTQPSIRLLASMLGYRGHLCRPAGRRPDIHCTQAPRGTCLLCSGSSSLDLCGPYSTRGTVAPWSVFTPQTHALTHCCPCSHGSLNCFKCHSVGSCAPLFGSSIWRRFGVCRSCVEPCFSSLGCRCGKPQATLMRRVAREADIAEKGHCLPIAQDISEIRIRGVRVSGPWSGVELAGKRDYRGFWGLGSCWSPAS